MSNTRMHTGLIVAIVFAGISIFASLVFDGVQLRQASVNKATIDETELTQKIEIGSEKYQRHTGEHPFK